MDTLNTDLMRDLVLHEDDVCISIFLPMIKAGDQKRQNPLQFKNMVKKAQNELERLGYRNHELDEILRPVYSYMNDKTVWTGQGDGLAVFLSRNTFIPLRLPVSFTPEFVTGRKFFVKPLFMLLMNDGAYYLVSLNLEGVKLFRGSRFSLGEIACDLPADIDDALKFDDTEPLRQSAARSAPFRGGDRTAKFFGHGIETEENKNRVLRYFKIVDKAIHEVVRGKEDPMVIAGNEYLIPIYREANTYPHLADAAVRKNSQAMSEDELHRESWEVIRPVFEEAQRTAEERYRRLAQTKLASDNLEEIVRSAANDRIDTLFVSKDLHVWGKYDRTNFSVSVHREPKDGDQDLLDLAVIETYLHNGSVFVTDGGEIPGKRPAGAIFRF